MYKKLLLLLMTILLAISLIACTTIQASSTGVPTSTPATSVVASNAKYATDLKVHFVDVGQADCILVELPNNQKMLVDAGNNEDKDTIISYLNSKSIKKIDYLIGTHPHEDHIGSLDSVISNYEIGSIYMPKISSNTKTFEDVLLAIKAKGLKVVAPETGTYILNDNQGLSIQVLAPNSSTYEDLNNFSIVLKLKYKDTSFLFTGDAESLSESEILKKSYDIKADVLKIGHHGSKSSTSAEFLKKVAPKYAVISAGAGNTYGHPNQETLAKLNEGKVQVYRTDIDGTIIFTTDGSKITVEKKASTTKENAPPQITNQQPQQQDAIIYIGNKNSRVFHRDSCRTLPDLKNQVKFSSREEAIKQGFKPCGNCKP